MLKYFYQEELGTLRELAINFVRTYPVLALILAARNADPDVEQLLERMAFYLAWFVNSWLKGFLTSLQSLLQILYLQLLHHIPYTPYTLMYFKPIQGYGNHRTTRLPKGSEVASILASPLNYIDNKVTDNEQ